MEEIYDTSKNRTLIIITHRHSSVFNCDIVYLLEKGKIIDGDQIIAALAKRWKNKKRRILGL